jgi:fatty-acyl-CoA synthase
VVPRADAQGTLSPGEILEFLSSRVAKWQLPDEVIFIDSVPKTSVGKFDKKVLRERFKDYKLSKAS